MEAYIAAKKQTQATKLKEGFMLIAMAYDKELILPYKDGLMFMASLSNAEQMSGLYDDRYITDLNTDTITAKAMSYKDYERYKIAALLKIKYKEVKDFEDKPI